MGITQVRYRRFQLVGTILAVLLLASTPAAVGAQTTVPQQCQAIVDTVQRLRAQEADLRKQCDLLPVNTPLRDACEAKLAEIARQRSDAERDLRDCVGRVCAPLRDQLKTAQTNLLLFQKEITRKTPFKPHDRPYIEARAKADVMADIRAAQREIATLRTLLATIGCPSR